MDTALANIVESAEAERLATGFVFTEAPTRCWWPASTGPSPGSRT
jgi:hypothetical protein